MRVVNLILLFCLFILVNELYAGGGTYPQGDHIKMLTQDKLETGGSLQQLIFGDSDDPTSVAKNAGAGSLYLRTTGIPYIKTDSGSSTNWTDILDHGSMTGLTDDDHSQYLALAGRGAEQTVDETVAFAQNIVQSHIPNPTFEAGTTGWSPYNDGGAYVNGIGGTNSALSIARNTTTPLWGSGDLKISNTGNCAGEGVTAGITIPRALQGQMVTIRFKKDGSGANYDDGDMEVYLYDDTNSKIIQPTDRTIYAGNSDYVSSFQAASDSTSYRLSFHCTATTGAFDLYVDNIEVAQIPVSYGVPTTDWVSFSATGGGFTVASTANGEYRRTGDTAEIRYYFDIDAVSTLMTVTLPAGLIIDDSKLPAGASSLQALGTVEAYDVSASLRYNGTAYRASTTTIRLGATSTNSDFWTTTAPITWATGDSLTAYIKVPIQGWSSNAAMSADFGNRDVVMSASVTTTSVPTATAATVIYTTKNKDTVNGYDNSTGIYEIQESGDYDFTAAALFDLALGWESGEYAIIYALINNVSAVNIARTGVFTSDSSASNQNLHVQTSGILTDLKKGDTVKIKVVHYNDATLALTGGAAYNYFQIAKRQSPQTIFESESVFANYTSNTLQSLVTATTVDFENKVEDFAGNVTTGSSWKFTAKESAVYAVDVTIVPLFASVVANQNVQMYLYKNDISTTYLSFITFESSRSSVYFSLSGSTKLYLEKGEYIDIRVTNNTSGSIITAADNRFNTISIAKIK